MKKFFLFSSGEIYHTVMTETLLRQTMKKNTNITFYSSETLHDEIANQEFNLLQLRKPT